MCEKKVTEFNRKILCAILRIDVCLSKWNKDVFPLCEICRVNEHILTLFNVCGRIFFLNLMQHGKQL